MNFYTDTSNLQAYRGGRNYNAESDYASYVLHRCWLVGHDILYLTVIAEVEVESPTVPSRLEFGGQGLLLSAFMTTSSEKALPLYPSTHVPQE